MNKININHALNLPLENNGILTIRADAIMIIKAGPHGGRNLACEVNGIKTLAGYDFVVSTLKWETHDVP